MANKNNETCLFILTKSVTQGIYHRLGDTLARLDQWAEAERFHQAALEVQPDHVATHVSYGTMLARNVSSTVDIRETDERWHNAQSMFKHDIY